MAEYDLDAEIGALQFLVLTLIASHPDAEKLLHEFDYRMKGTRMSQNMLETLTRYRRHVESAI